MQQYTLQAPTHNTVAMFYSRKRAQRIISEQHAIVPDLPNDAIFVANDDILVVAIPQSENTIRITSVVVIGDYVTDEQQTAHLIELFSLLNYEHITGPDSPTSPLAQALAYYSPEPGQTETSAVRTPQSLYDWARLPPLAIANVLSFARIEVLSFRPRGDFFNVSMMQNSTKRFPRKQLPISVCAYLPVRVGWNRYVDGGYQVTMSTRKILYDHHFYRFGPPNVRPVYRLFTTLSVV